jgi:Ca2+/Na+ antiporter
MAKIFSIFFALVSSSQLSIILIAVGTIFLIFIVIAVIKTYKLNAESKKLAEMDSKSEDDNNYKDFTDGHLYDNK